MSDAANFTEQEQWELDNEDPIMGLWRMRNEARAALEGRGRSNQSAHSDSM
jgi:hypothetical protein